MNHDENRRGDVEKAGFGFSGPSEYYFHVAGLVIDTHPIFDNGRRSDIQSHLGNPESLNIPGLHVAIASKKHVLQEYIVVRGCFSIIIYYFRSYLPRSGSGSIRWSLKISLQSPTYRLL